MPSYLVPIYSLLAWKFLKKSVIQGVPNRFILIVIFSNAKKFKFLMQFF